MSPLIGRQPNGGVGSGTLLLPGKNPKTGTADEDNRRKMSLEMKHVPSSPDRDEADS
ncbi:MAG: hypothetical protein GKC04_00295 [Methanomicrobiales archaeon]|nr:hypothetical protein [Methanomicrobiales archaeon]